MQIEDSIAELKHSVKTHLLIMAGPSQQLCAFLLKVIDFLDDPDLTRVKEEIINLSYLIIEGLALYLNRVVQDKLDKAKSNKEDVPHNLIQSADNLLIVVGKSRNIEDKISAKNALLTCMADLLRQLEAYTKSKYVTLADSRGNKL